MLVEELSVDAMDGLRRRVMGRSGIEERSGFELGYTALEVQYKGVDAEDERKDICNTGSRGDAHKTGSSMNCGDERISGRP